MIEEKHFERAFALQAIEWRKHALERMIERGISRDEVREVVLQGEIIEEYETNKPFPSALFYKTIGERPLHILVAFDKKEPQAFVITAYEPTLDKFEPDFKTRRKT